MFAFITGVLFTPFTVELGFSISHLLIFSWGERCIGERQDISDTVVLSHTTIHSLEGTLVDCSPIGIMLRSKEASSGVLSPAFLQQRRFPFFQPLAVSYRIAPWPVPVRVSLIIITERILKIFLRRTGQEPCLFPAQRRLLNRRQCRPELLEMPRFVPIRRINERKSLVLRVPKAWPNEGVQFPALCIHHDHIAPAETIRM